MAMLFRPKPIPNKYRELYDKINQGSVRLDNICSVYRGIWTGVLHVFVVTENEIHEYGLEEEALKPLLRGRDVFPFRYKWDRRWIIYTRNKNFKEKYPNVMRYLSKFRTILERRGAVWVYRREWWELEEPLSPEMFEVEKILSPYISRFNSFAYEEGKYYVLDSTSVIRFWRNENELEDYIVKWNKINETILDIKKASNTYNQLKKDMIFDSDALLYLLGILNSDLIEFTYKLYAPRLTKRGSTKPKGKYYLYVPPHLNVLPIKIVERSHRLEIIRQVREIMNTSAKLNELSEDDPEYASVRDSIEEEILLMKADLNEMVYQIYDLSDLEISILQAYVLRKR